MMPAVIRCFSVVANRPQHVALSLRSKRAAETNTIAVSSAHFPRLPPWATRFCRFAAIQPAHAYAHELMLVRETL